MAKKILVAYATRVGSTIEIAEAIAAVLQEWGVEVEVRSTHERLDIEHYDGVVLGSAIRMGHLLPEAVEFLQKNRQYLKTIPVAYFTACITMTEDTEENRETVLHYFDPIMQAVPEVRPISIGLFAGEIDTHKLGMVPRIAIKMIHAPIGDYRNWAKIRSWASVIAPQLMSEPEMLYP